MSDYLGDIAVGATVRAWLDTEDASGAAVTLGSAAAHALKDGSGSQITSGITITTDLDGTGIHRVNVDTSVMAAGEYAIVATGTVSGVSISRLVAQFSIANRTLNSFSAMVSAIITAIGTAFGVGSYLRNTEPDNTGIGVAAAAAASAATDASTLVGRLTAIRAAKLDNLPEGVKKNTALSNVEFFMADASDHVSGKTGLTVTATRSIDGAALGACANSPAEVSGGVYKIDLAAADLNGDIITFIFSATGADPFPMMVKTSA